MQHDGDRLLQRTQVWGVAQLLEGQFDVVNQPRMCNNELRDTRAVGESDGGCAGRSAQIFHAAHVWRTTRPAAQMVMKGRDMIMS